MNQYKDYYRILGIPKTATDKEIKSVYKLLVKKYHPDVNKDAQAEAIMKEINEAYTTLSDSDRKRQYDALFAPVPHFNTNMPPNIRWVHYDVTPTNTSWSVTIEIQN